MGKIVEFRSRYKAAGRVTSCMAATAGFLAAETGLSIAMVQFDEKNDICEMFDRHLSDRGKKEIYGKTGLSALLLMLRAGRPDEEKVRACALKTIDPGLDIFHGPGFAQGEEEEGLKDLILEEIKNAYDLVFVDCGNGKRTAADITVQMLPQSRRAWKEEFNEKQKENGKCLYAVNGFLSNSVCGTGLFRFKYGKKLFTLRMSAGFMDALAEGNTAEFFRNTGNLGKIEKLLPDSPFREDVSLLAKEIVQGGRIED
ncbi:MAG: hypothetical protein K6F63_01915 [Lachnospiraceae bacterium]|nr:hypothetical protein [Lachnospiraceae bacterium]